MLNKKDNEIRPSKEIWDYYSRNSSNGESGISIELILSSIADKSYGFHISYSATELLKDIDCLNEKGNITKKAKLILARELHSRYHQKRPNFKLINPNQEDA
jgi:hypothetical protein